MNRQMIIYSSIGAAVVVVLLLYGFFAYTPLAKKVSARKAALEMKQAEFAVDEDLLKQQDAYNERATKLRIEKGRLKEQLPVEPQIPELLKSVTVAATACRMNDFHFSLLPLEMTEDFGKQKVQITVTCHYHALGLFISKLAELPRLINTQVVEINSVDKTGTKDSITAKLILETYVQKAKK